jgi:CheY-like chemotaxis protein
VLVAEGNRPKLKVQFRHNHSAPYHLLTNVAFRLATAATQPTEEESAISAIAPMRDQGLIMVTSSTLVSIVDDDPGTRDALGGLLRSLGYAVEAFASAEEFLNWTGRADTNCIVIDFAMPGMDGLELQKRLNSEGSHSLVIFLSGNDLELFRDRALDAGACGVFLKPYLDPVVACLKATLGEA